MKKIGFIKYETPKMEVLEVEVEKGFAASPEDDETGGSINPVLPG